MDHLLACKYARVEGKNSYLDSTNHTQVAWDEQITFCKTYQYKCKCKAIYFCHNVRQLTLPMYLRYPSILFTAVDLCDKHAS